MHTGSTTVPTSFGDQIVDIQQIGIRRIRIEGEGELTLYAIAIDEELRKRGAD